MSSSGQTITKKEFVHRIADETGQTKVVVKDILQRFLDGITQELADGNRIEFREFGVFEVRERAARRAQNPRTLEQVEVPGRRMVKFKSGRKMRLLVGSAEAALDGQAVEAPGPESTGSSSPQDPPQPPPATPGSPF